MPESWGERRKVWEGRDGLKGRVSGQVRDAEAPHEDLQAHYNKETNTLRF